MSEVLALKYRPSSFDKLIGQDSITQTLTHALDQDRLSHAYLFSGLRGSGKTSTARIFAKAMICKNAPTSKPCQECENCRLANENRHIDIIEMDAASSRKIDDIRSLIEQTKYKPNMARYKIFIIDEVHMLTKEAFNALLKTLEEPPEYVKFILATTDPMKLPATILSRTQHFRFKKIAQSEVVKHLSHILNKEGVEFEQEALSMLSRAGNGSLRDTLTLLDQAILYSKRYVDAKSVATMLGLLDPAMLDNIFSSIFKKDDKLVLNYIKELDEYEAEIVIDELIAYLKIRFFEGDSRFSTLICDRFFRILSQSKALLFQNADNSFVLTLLFFKMMESTKLDEVQKAIEELEKKVTLQPKSDQKQIEQPAKIVAVPKTTSQESTHQEEAVSTNDKKGDKFTTLIDKLYDRNYELGEVFKNSVKLISYDESEIKLLFKADEESLDALRAGYAHIKQFIFELFGFGIKIDITKESPSEDDKSTAKKKDEPMPPTSCIEEQVVGESQMEQKEENILDDPFVKKAQELFEPSRIVVKSKV